MAVNAVSMSPAVVAVRRMSCSLMARAAFCNSAGCRAGLFGFMRRATIVALGTSSCSSPSRLGPSSALNQLTPVTLPARPIDADDKAAFDRVVAAREDDRDCTGRLHGDERRIVASGRGDHGHLTSNEISRERRQPI